MILENYKLQKVLHVSTFKFNLLSVSKLTKQLSCSVSFYPDFYLFQELFTGRVIGIGRERDGLYILREQKIKPAINTTVSKCSSEAVAFETGACINEDIRAHQDITKHHKQEYTIQLNLSEGDLSGRIPPQVGNLTHLTRLDLSRNNLHGPIPTSLLNLQSLCYLDLSENSLSGNLPAFQMKSLQYMDLRGNKLDGPVPKSFLNLQSLYYLDLSDNSLSEYLPAFRMKSLRYIDLGSNCFTGQIPREYGALQSLETLYIYNNLLNGGIPQELGKLSNLVVFAMNDNRLSGHIPYQLGWLTQLQYLDLSTNYFVGELPLSFKQLTNLIQFVAHGNSLSGKIPKLIANWKELGMLILLGNNFKGPWPKEISSMDSLLNLQLSNVVTKGRAYDFPDLSPMTSLEDIEELFTSWSHTELYLGASTFIVSGLELQRIIWRSAKIHSHIFNIYVRIYRTMLLLIRICTYQLIGEPHLIRDLDIVFLYLVLHLKVCWGPCPSKYVFQSGS
ncbi:probable leucine-rich repeat receptor-like protein kinase At1g35710 isoform X3 [Lycium barbarum]|uniref:probable leucine-rich repeat receptor-like protein kinase At1g35710 isoform X3 n=1 Tax=Lycium barbarum TaxID=112863 RepID=UPI00293F52FD|nr:probable leucine-rich repeat receptor-like protein kinase At1g35710 isoform X3 [Lycium barbarum]